MAANGFGSAMFEQAGRGSRILFVGFAFLAFDIGGLMVRMLFFPLLLVSVRDEQSRAEVARDFIGWSYRSLIAFLRSSGVLDYKVIGAEKLERPGLLILANHPTFLDIVFLMAVVKRSDCIVKSGLWRNPFLRGPVIAANYIRNDHSAGLMHDCVAALSRGESLIIFPEGTRTPLNGALKLQRDAAHIAVRSGCNITPVLIRCQPPMLARGVRWWKLPKNRSRFDIEVKDEIDIQPFVARGERGFGGTAPDRSSARFFCKGTAHPCKRLKMR
jgi:1-acyl-sn-glycerol-3-phosphate acyltransferase